ncbi:MAG: CoA-binding protein [Candidatus Thermoplasmatota archaeon]|nr:CoA-binding protein [Candidatus Thermoplasmatota archaeon]
MDAFFSPDGVAVVGASANPGKIGYEIFKNVLASAPNAYPVNPSSEVILGERCYPSVRDISGEVDLAVVAVPPKLVPDIVDDCGEKNVPAMVVISGGFKEVGNEGLEQDMLSRARRHGIRIIGPNCIGVYNGATGFNTFFQRDMELPGQGPVAVLTQSGTVGIGLLETCSDIGISKFVSYGNAADVDERELLSYLAGDPATEVIAMYVEGVTDGRALFEKLPDMPVVMLKAGRTASGKTAAASHTGAMASRYALFKGAARQHGAIVADSFEELHDLASLLALQPLPQGGRVAMITNGAGPCVLAADAIHETRHLRLADVDAAGLKELPSFAIRGNPVDLTGSATAGHYLAGIRALFEDDDVDIIMPFFVFKDAPLLDTLDELYRGLASLDASKPVVTVALGSRFVAEQQRRLLEMGIPLISEPARAVAALDKVAWYAGWRR